MIFQCQLRKNAHYHNVVDLAEAVQVEIVQVAAVAVLAVEIVEVVLAVEIADAQVIAEAVLAVETVDAQAQVIAELALAEAVMVDVVKADNLVHHAHVVKTNF